MEWTLEQNRDNTPSTRIKYRTPYSMVSWTLGNRFLFYFKVSNELSCHGHVIQKKFIFLTLLSYWGVTTFFFVFLLVSFLTSSSQGIILFFLSSENIFFPFWPNEHTTTYHAKSIFEHIFLWSREHSVLCKSIHRQLFMTCIIHYKGRSEDLKIHTYGHVAKTTS